jgi:hypothetical protein
MDRLEEESPRAVRWVTGTVRWLRWGKGVVLKLMVSKPNGVRKCPVQASSSDDHWRAERIQAF